MKDSSAKPNWKLIIRWIGTILSLLLMVYLLYNAGFDEILIALKRIPLARVFLMILLIFTSRIATFLRWHSLLQIENLKINWKDSLRLTFAGLFAANFLPTTIGGDVVRLAGAMRLGISGTLATASLMTDRLIGMAGMAVMLPIGLKPLISYLNSRAHQDGTVLALGTFTNHRFIEKTKSSIRKFLDNFQYWIKHPKYLLISFFFTFIHMTALFLIVKIIVTELGENMTFWQIAGIWSLTYFITLIPISINGLGLQEVTITNLYTYLGGLSSAGSLTIAIIIRGLFVIASLPGAFFISGILSGDKYSDLIKKRAVGGLNIDNRDRN